MDIRAGEHCPHAAVEGRGQRCLHLHGLDDRDDAALVDLVTDGNGDRHHHGGRETADEASVVARDPVRHAVHLDEQVRVLDGGQRAVAHAMHLDPMLVAAEPVARDLDRLAVDRDAVPVRRDL